MGLPDPRKKKKKYDNAWMKNIHEIAAALGCAPSTENILAAVMREKEELNLIRKRLGLPDFEYRWTAGIIERIDRLEQAAALEIAIQKVLTAYPFKRARLLVTLAKLEGRTGAYEATLSAKAVGDDAVLTGRMPFADVIELREKRSVVLERANGVTMIAAVAGLTPK